jgi:hypothetical protein
VPMMRTSIASALGVVAVCAAVPPSAVAQTSSLMRNSQVVIAYVEPSDPAFRPIYDRLKKRQALEELQEFLAPLELPRKILVKTDQCGKLSQLYDPSGIVTICYEYVAEIERLAPKERTPRGVTRGDAVVGAFVQVVLYEMSYAVFDVLKVPVWGREADAADKLAGFLMLQFGTDVARRTLNGAAYFFEASGRTWTGSDFSDVKGTEAQRFYNYLCVAYGGDRQAFKDFVAQGGNRSSAGGAPASRVDLLPVRRAERCPREFNDLRYAFEETIMPHVNAAMLKEVLGRSWLRPDDGQW